MRIFSTLGRIFISWYVAAPVLAILGIAIGYALFFHGYPGKPKIGVIDIPYTGINEDAAYVITAYLDYCRRDPDIKAVVIKMASPGGGASASEQLYIETRRLREEKPVVMAMNGIVASGGYMMALGTNYTYTKTSTLVGNVGVVAGSPPVLPPLAPEFIAHTGPYKLSGSSRRDWIATIDRLNEAFIEMTVRERGDRLKISRTELAEGRLYAGVDAVRLGFADGIGSDAQALEKAAELAGIANYEMVNVNVEVNRQFVQDLRRIYSSHGDADSPLTEADARLMNIFVSRQSPEIPNSGASSNQVIPESEDLSQVDTSSDLNQWVNVDGLQRPLEYGVLGVPPEQAFPELPVEFNQPKFYYLHIGANP